MDEKLPLVSVVITSYNRQQWIAQAIESALQQNYPNLEIVVNDDCSTDNSVEVIKPYLNDPRVRFFRNEKNLGIALNYRLTFMELAKGDYLMNLGSDDYLENPSFISDAIKAVGNRQDGGIIFGRSKLFFEKTGELVSNDPVREELLFHTTMNKGMDIFFLPPFISRGWGGCLVNAHIMRANNINFSDIKLCDDQRINFMLMAVSDVVCLNEPCYIIRMHDNNLGVTAMSADAAINDILGMIEQSHAYAQERKAADPTRLLEWKNEFLFYHVRYTLLYMIVNRPAEFRKFAGYVKTKYPAIYRQIVCSKKFLYVKYLYNPIVRPAKRLFRV